MSQLPMFIGKPQQAPAPASLRDRGSEIGRARGAAAAVPSSQPTVVPANTPGYLFVCTSATESECFSRQLFGLGGSRLQSMSSAIAQHSTPIFLLNFKTRMVHGVFEAVGRPAMNIEADAWSKQSRGGRGRNGAGSGSSGFPAQVRVRPMGGAPAGTISHAQLTNGWNLREGPLSADTVSKLAALLGGAGAEGDGAANRSAGGQGQGRRSGGGAAPAPNPDPLAVYVKVSLSLSLSLYLSLSISDWLAGTDWVAGSRLGHRGRGAQRGLRCQVWRGD